MGTIWHKEPALIVGAAVAVVLQVVGALVGQGFISEAVGGRITDIAEALGALGIAVLPLITAYLIRGRVYSPETLRRLTGPVGSIRKPDAS